MALHILRGGILVAVVMASFGCAPTSSAARNSSACVAATQAELAALAAEADLSFCPLEIYDSELEHLNGLDGLRLLRAAILVNNARLRDVAVLTSANTTLDEPLDSFSLQGSLLSADVDLTNVARLLRVEATSASRMHGAQTEMESVHLDDNPTLSVVSFPALRSVFNLGLEGNPLLTTAEFPALESAQELTIRRTQLTEQTINDLASQANVPAESIFHCGNADDDPCDDVAGL